MAVDILELVKFHVKPALAVDETLETDLPIVINAQTAQQGWPEPLTDKQCVYIAAISLEALLPRLALIFTEEVQERRAGVETTKLPNRSDFFKQLRLAIQDMKATAGSEAGVTVAEEELPTPWPGIGIARW